MQRTSKKEGRNLEDRQGIQSVEVGFRVLSALVERNSALSLKEIGAAAGLSPSNTHRYMTSLTRIGLARQISDGRYDLGPLALRFGFSALARLDVIDICTERMRVFSNETDISTMLSVWSERGPIILRWVQGSQPVFSTISTGSVMPLFGSATGQIFLAYQDKGLVDAFLKANRKLPAPVARADRMRMVEDIRAAGMASVTGDLIPGLLAAACPVINGFGELVAVITAVASHTTPTIENIERFKVCCRDASRDLGWHESFDPHAVQR